MRQQPHPILRGILRHAILRNLAGPLIEQRAPFVDLRARDHGPGKEPAKALEVVVLGKGPQQRPSSWLGGDRIDAAHDILDVLGDALVIHGEQVLEGGQAALPWHGELILHEVHRALIVIPQEFYDGVFLGEHGRLDRRAALTGHWRRWRKLLRVRIPRSIEWGGSRRGNPRWCVTALGCVHHGGVSLPAIRAEDGPFGQQLHSSEQRRSVWSQ
jgi:hypothetical protein